MLLDDDRRASPDIESHFEPDTFTTLESVIGSPNSFIFLERYVDRGSYHQYAHYSEVSKQYRPVDGDPDFALPYLILSPEKVKIFAVNPDSRVSNWITENGQVKFFIHPDMVDIHGQFEQRSVISQENFQGTISARPTASTRTVQVSPDNKLGIPPFMIKLDLEKVISRFMRELDKKRVQFSLQVSTALHQAATSLKCPSSLGFLPETFGACLEFKDGHSIGYLVREFNPRPATTTRETLVPLFALFSPNKANPYGDLLIYQLLENIMHKHQLVDPSETLLQYVFRPCLESWAYLAYNCGLLPERHAQNGLLSLDSEGIPVRVVDRDFQGFNVDITTRREKGLSTDFCHHVIDPDKRSVVLSRCYDHRMGFQVFDPILEVVAQRYGEDVRVRTQEGIRKLFYQLTPPGFLEIFPSEQYGLDNTTMFRDRPTADVAKSQPPPYR